MMSLHDGLILFAMGTINFVVGLTVLNLRKQPKHSQAPLQRASSWAK